LGRLKPLTAFSIKPMFSIIHSFISLLLYEFNTIYIHSYIQGRNIIRYHFYSSIIFHNSKIPQLWKIVKLKLESFEVTKKKKN